MNPYPSAQETENYLESIKILEEKYNNTILSISNGKKIDKNYTDSLQSITNTNKKILLFFHMDGCPGCIIIDYLMKYNEEIKSIINSKYHLIIINGQKTKTSLIEKYNIYSYPCLIQINSEEKIIKKNIGCDVIGGADINLIKWLNDD